MLQPNSGLRLSSDSVSAQNLQPRLQSTLSDETLRYWLQYGSFAGIVLRWSNEWG